jgi:hypothetical protein
MQSYGIELGMQWPSETSFVVQDAEAAAQSHGLRSQRQLPRHRPFTSVHVRIEKDFVHACPFWAWPQRTRCLVPEDELARLLEHTFGVQPGGAVCKKLCSAKQCVDS